jgi:hypothetical protein
MDLRGGAASKIKARYYANVTVLANGKKQGFYDHININI